MRTVNVRILLSIVWVVAMTLSLSTPMSTAAQAAGSWQLSNGQTLAWSDFYELDQEFLVTGDGFEILDLLSPVGIVRVISTSFAASGSEVRNIAVEDLEASVQLRQVDRGDYDNVSYSLDTTNLEGIEVGIFTLVVEGGSSTLLTMLISPVEVFQFEMEIAQDEVTIGGSGIFDGVDAAVMQQHLTNATGVALMPVNDPAPTPAPPTPTPAVPAPTPTPAPANPTPTPAPTASAGSGSLITDLNSGLGGEEPSPDQDGGQPTPAASGSTSNSVTIASSGVVIQYSGDWSINIEEASRVQLISNGEPRVVAAFLDLDTGISGGSAMVLAQSLLETPDLVAPEIVEALDLENGRMLIVLADRDPAGEIYMIYDLVPSGSTITASLLVADVAQLGPAVDLVQSTLQVDGQPVFVNLQQIVPDIFTPGS